MSHNQTYLQLFLLATSKADLGLYQHEPLKPQSQGRNRAFVGCYYLCSSLSASAFDRPDSMRRSVNMRRCAEIVVASGTLSTDRLFDAIPELAHVIDGLVERIQDQQI